LFIDLDRFKTVNDSLGHAVGDLMLMEIAGRLTERLRASDIVARLGGDEFVVVLPDLPDVQHAALVAQALLEDLEKPIKAPSTELHTSGSIGIAIYPDNGTTVEALMQSADTAMYEAKAAGRNAFRFFTAEMTDSANDRLLLENDLRSALIKEQFALHYQPQVSPVDGRIVGVEALLRWKHPTGGMIGPDRFIPIAEETGLIVEIGAWVLTEGCRQARQWLDAGFAIRMSINLSARQLRSDNLLPLIERTLAEYRLPSHALELEITESALMERPDQAVAILKDIKAMGVALALDDFGTGYSSLSYLKRFPIDRLKIDRSFVRDIETDPNDRAIALSTIALAHSLGLEVTAEGVEEAAQRDFLREHGCDGAQGWLYSKAVPAGEAETLLRKGYLP
jgi:diguanylate cyclase (GGDEF)-like protein